MTASWTQQFLGSRTFDLYTPPKPPRFGLLFLLDVDGKSLSGSSTFTRLLERFNLACIALPACPSWWSDRLCPEFHPTLSAEQHIMQDVLTVFRQHWDLAPRALAVVGIG